MGSCDVGLMQMFSLQKRSKQTFESPTIACVYSRNSQTLTRVSLIMLVHLENYERTPLESTGTKKTKIIGLECQILILLLPAC